MPFASNRNEYPPHSASCFETRSFILSTTDAPFRGTEREHDLTHDRRRLIRWQLILRTVPASHRGRLGKLLQSPRVSSKISPEDMYKLCSRSHSSPSPSKCVWTQRPSNPLPMCSRLTRACPHRPLHVLWFVRYWRRREGRSGEHDLPSRSRTRPLTPLCAARLALLGGKIHRVNFIRRSPEPVVGRSPFEAPDRSS